MSSLVTDFDTLVFHQGGSNGLSRHKRRNPCEQPVKAACRLVERETGAKRDQQENLSSGTGDSAFFVDQLAFEAGYQVHAQTYVMLAVSPPAEIP
jgi:hypothetical protein